MRRLLSFVVITVTAISFTTTADFAFAQRNAASKAAGQYNFYGNYSHRSMRNARAYSYDYRPAVQSSSQQADTASTREASDPIGTYIVKAQKHMAWMRKNAGNDKEALASLDTIDKKLAEAKRLHDGMDKAHPKSNDVSLKERHKQLDELLAAVVAEHDKLMKRLGLPNPTLVKK